MDVKNAKISNGPVAVVTVRVDAYISKFGFLRKPGLRPEGF